MKKWIDGITLKHTQHLHHSRNRWAKLEPKLTEQLELAGKFTKDLEQTAAVREMTLGDAYGRREKMEMRALTSRIGGRKRLTDTENKTNRRGWCRGDASQWPSQETMIREHADNKNNKRVLV